MFLIGLVPLWLVMRAKVWGLSRRLLIAERPPLGTPTPRSDNSVIDESEAQPS